MRRFNQASLLADDIAARSHLPVEHLILTRKYATRAQIGLSAKERRKNVAKAFDINAQHAHMLKDKRVLLIDDVVTTGSTIEACTKTLQRAGARHVNILAFACVTDRVKTL
jgi:predicted amidophosphoribosyltransferase